jgi:membrane-associated protease RseP (regulator of RpoE activity)
VSPKDLIESTTPPQHLAPLRFEEPDSPAFALPKNRLWLHALLLAMTLFTTTLVGAHMQYNFTHNLAFFEVENYLDIFTLGLRSPALFLSGLPFSLTLLTILMAHEMGHYLACLYYGVDATMPFFLPGPTPFTGTFGAFIRIRSAIPSKRVLFDIGIAGPLAGFVFLVPALGVGLAFSKVIPGINHEGITQLGAPALQWILERTAFPGIPSADIYPHPVARAAWVGMFATALNLLPAGQLDGGHIVYALLGRAHKWITLSLVFVLLPLGCLWWGWWFWAVLLFVFARRHPPIYDSTEIGASRIRLGFLALVVFALCFSYAPIIG